MLRLDLARNGDAADLDPVATKLMAQTTLRNHVGATNVAVVAMIALSGRNMIQRATTKTAIVIRKPHGA